MNQQLLKVLNESNWIDYELNDSVDLEEFNYLGLLDGENYELVALPSKDYDGVKKAYDELKVLTMSESDMLRLYK